MSETAVLELTPTEQRIADAKPSMCEGCPLRHCQDFNPIRLGMESDIVVVYGTVSKFATSMEPSGSYERVLTETIRKQCGKLPNSEKPTIGYTAAVKCKPPEDLDKVNADIYKQCSPRLLAYLDKAKPKVIITLGTEAMRSVGIKGTVASNRGAILDHSLGGHKCKVIPTFHTFQIYKQPGLVNIFEKDIKKAFNLVTGGESGLKEDKLKLTYADNLEDTLKYLNKIRDRIKQLATLSGNKQTVSIDTETTGLHPYDDNQRMITISISWEKGYGLAYQYEHRDCNYSKKDLAKIKKATEEMLDPKYCVLVMHNAKFDNQWLKFKYGFNIEFAVYDTMLGEHCLDEDKKGEYSLKDLTKDYFPNFGLYEGKLKEYLDNINTERQEAYKEAKKEAAEQIKKAKLDYWISLDEDNRIKHCAAWLDKGYNVNKLMDLISVETRKLKGEIVVLKRYENAVFKMLKIISPEDLGLELPEFDVPEPENATFEDVPAEVLLPYAAMDAVITRAVVDEQRKLMNEDSKVIKRIAKRAKSKQNTPALYSSLRKLSMPLCNSLAHMEYHGVKMDRERIKSYIDKLEETLGITESELYKQVGYKFNLSSSSNDLKDILFKEMGYKPLKFSDKTGEPSTDIETLKELSEKHDDDFLKLLMSQRKIDKCINTYLKSWLKRSELDGKIHCSFNQIGTATYRLSSSNPNLQNVPFYLREADLNLKALFIPDSDDFDLYDMDIANAEMRVLCAYSQDKAMIDAFNNGKDLHCLTAAGISDFSYEDILANKEDKESPHYKVRQIAKKVIVLAFYKLR